MLVCLREEVVSTAYIRFLAQVGARFRYGYTEGGSQASQSLHSRLLLRKCATHEFRSPQEPARHGAFQLACPVRGSSNAQKLARDSTSQPPYFCIFEFIMTWYCPSTDRCNSCNLSTASTTAREAIIGSVSCITRICL